MSKSKPLSLGGTLRDLALLRAADIDLSTLVGKPDPASIPPQPNAVDLSVARSYEFSREARAVINAFDRGLVDKERIKLNELESRLQEIQEGLGPDPAGSEAK
jgi:hypothetical protein